MNVARSNISVYFDSKVWVSRHAAKEYNGHGRL
jgi:hypothetical protein